MLQITFEQIDQPFGRLLTQITHPRHISLHRTQVPSFAAHDLGCGKSGEVAYPDTGLLLDRLTAATSSVRHFDALAAAQTLFGNTAAANFLIVGAAVQSGGLRLPAAAIEEAIGINGVAVDSTIAAFRWGRAAIADPAAYAAPGDDGRPPPTPPPPPCAGAGHVGPPRRTPPPVPAHLLAHTDFEGEVRRLVERRAAELIGYQNATVARRYVDTVQRVWSAERAVTDRTDFSAAVARGLYKFTAYKDEYEVARLLVDPAFLAEVRAQVPGGEKLTYQLHPPVLRAMGRRKKVGFAPKSHGVLKVLAKGKVLRGTRFDPFGYAHVRKIERELLAHYTDMVRRLADELTSESYDIATKAAELPDVVRGYEDVKLGNVELYWAGLRELGIEH